MLNKLKKSNREGFTIIEVMIVLAIAGLIILIVLLAVPALQRNSRNTAIKNDASAVAAAVNEFKSNNDGATPGMSNAATTGISTTGTNVNVAGAAGTSAASATVQQGTDVQGATGTAPAAALAPGAVRVYSGARCDGGASTRAITVWYSIETRNAVPTSTPWNNKCIDA